MEAGVRTRRPNNMNVFQRTAKPVFGADHRLTDAGALIIRKRTLTNTGAAIISVNGVDQRL